MEQDSEHHPHAIEDIPWRWLNEEKWRLHTFSRYPNSTKKSAILLAAAGFVYFGSGRSNDDRVICCFCCVIKQNWRSSDIIAVVHRDLSPGCPMVTGIGCNNVPMTAPLGRLSLFLQLNAGETGPIEVEQQITGQEIGREVTESDSNHVHRQSLNQSTQNLPVLTAANSGHGTSAQAATQIQTANQTVMSTGNFTSSHTGQSATISARPIEFSAQGSHTNSSNTGTRAQGSHTNSSSTRSATAAVLAATTCSSTTSSNVNQITSLPQGQGNPSRSAPGETQISIKPKGKSPTYLELGIITRKYQKLEYSVWAKRFESFEYSPIYDDKKKEDLANAGFFYAGYADCARCFCCGGGLRNWEKNDNVWVEHARWFPQCHFIRQSKGQQFVDAVQDLNRDHDQITLELVVQKMRGSSAPIQTDARNMPLKRDPAVITILDMGYKESDVIEAAHFVKDADGTLSADKLFEKLERDGKQRVKTETFVGSRSIRRTAGTTKDEIIMNQLKEENSQLRQQIICKICLEKEIEMLFLPCGHLVSCKDCASALSHCPVCRSNIRAIVRAFIA